MEFTVFGGAVSDQFQRITSGKLFVTGAGKDGMWETYLNSFPEGTNEIFRTRKEFDCQCCKQFIRACGNVVMINPDTLQLETIWDIKIGGYFQVVADAMAAYVKLFAVKDIFLHYQRNVGTKSNVQLLENAQTITWNHFYFKLPNRLVRKDGRATELAKFRSNKDVFIRGLKEIKVDAIKTTIELIEQGSVYRGDEYLRAIGFFLDLKQEYDEVLSYDVDEYTWLNANEKGARIRNTVIGTLLTDISEDMALDQAVYRFNHKMDPDRFKRPTALVTKSMLARAKKKVIELGFENSLARRYAVMDDITITNTLFADRTAKEAMDVFDEIGKQIPVSGQKRFDKVEEVDIESFVNTILPKSEAIEIMLENKHENNLMSLISPVDQDAPCMLKWGNNFSWVYNNEVTDSLMKERVKRAGGNVHGIIRYSLQWNEDGNNKRDFDAHCFEPNGNHISYPVKRQVQPSSGVLDVDIIDPGNKVAVENITWSELHKMQEGQYRFLVHNYSSQRSTAGFTTEIEYGGTIYTFVYDKVLRGGEKVEVAVIDFDREKGIKFIKSLSSTIAQKEMWGLTTQTFQKVNLIMNSPNHWDGNSIGNKHYFFIMEDCLKEGRARGFFNEFLKEDIHDHRKVFEVLGSKMKAPESPFQLSGLGFSSTRRNSVLCKVSGAFSRTMKITF